MTEPDSALPAREQAPRHTTPTWEMELLISGATVFALLQLPAALDSGLYAAFPRFDRAMGSLVLLPYVYIKSATYALIVAFVLHLATRGYWVALVGLRSVHPDGVRWSELRSGPIYLATLRARTPPLDELVERADNRASQVFGYGVGFALLMLAPLVLVVGLGLLAYGISMLFGGRFEWLDLWIWMLPILLLPLGLAVVIDRLLGRRIEAEGNWARALQRVFRIYLRAGFSSFASYPMLMFMSRNGQRRGSILMTLAMLSLVGVLFAQIAWREGDFDPGSYRYLPTIDVGGSRSLHPEHYANQRGNVSSLQPVPFIPDEIVRGNYLRLFVPFRPDRDNAAMERACPQSRGESSEAPDAVLDCLAKLFPLSVDGRSIVHPGFDLAQDKESGLRGMLTMIRVSDLPPGRHVLEVARPVSATRKQDAASLQPYRIPFWR